MTSSTSQWLRKIIMSAILVCWRKNSHKRSRTCRPWWNATQSEVCPAMRWVPRWRRLRNSINTILMCLSVNKIISRRKCNRWQLETLKDFRSKILPPSSGSTDSLIQPSSREWSILPCPNYCQKHSRDHEFRPARDPISIIDQARSTASIKYKISHHLYRNWKDLSPASWWCGGRPCRYRTQTISSKSSIKIK